MTGFRKWVQNCFDNLVDPDKEAEVAELKRLLHNSIREQKQAFVLARTLRDRLYKERHLEQAKLSLYQEYLKRAWCDGRVNATERETLAWVAKCLELPPTSLRALNLESARSVFAESLAQAMDDGEITDAEAVLLGEIAMAAGLPLNQFVKQFFRSEGEAFLRGIFAASVAENRQYAPDLERLVTTAAKLGLSRPEVLEAIQPQAIRLIEHALADAKEDEELSTKEEAKLNELLQIFTPPVDTWNYVTTEIRILRVLTDVKRGKLPSLPAPAGISVRAGELVHHCARATWECLKLLKSGPTRVYHDGSLTITDSRLLFSSPTRSQAISLRKVIAHEFTRGTIEVQIQGKPTDRFACDEQPRLCYAIFSSALAMANQTLVNQDESRRSRHIPRDVRQRVWQRYSGQCAECRATSYLEFDHIVPVAKGGSNADGNVQLLCRSCNLKKSDMI